MLSPGSRRVICTDIFGIWEEMRKSRDGKKLQSCETGGEGKHNFRLVESIMSLFYLMLAIILQSKYYCLSF